MILTPETSCPYCNHKVDALSSVGGNERNPKKGDLTVCLYCGELLQLNAELLVGKLRKSEFYKLPMDIQLTLNKISTIIKNKNAAN